MKVILDSNVFDDLLDGTLSYELLLNSNIEIFATHIQVEELTATPETEKKEHLLHALRVVEPAVIPTESFVIGTSRIGFAKIGSGDIINKIRTGEKGNWKHTNDALIGETAIKNGLTLI